MHNREQTNGLVSVFVFPTQQSRNPRNLAQEHEKKKPLKLICTFEWRTVKFGQDKHGELKSCQKNIIFSRQHHAADSGYSRRTDCLTFELKAETELQMEKRIQNREAGQETCLLKMSDMFPSGYLRLKYVTFFG